jgi:phospholipase C
MQGQEHTESSEWSRRAFLGTAAGAAGALAASRWARAADALVGRAVATAPAGSGLDAIQHVVVVMQENRSFDHYFGAYPGVRGFDDHAASGLGAFAQRWPGGAASKLLPYKLDHATVQAQCAGGSDTPIHDWGPQHDSWAKGQMSRFVSTHSKPQFDGPAQGPLVMAYLDRTDIPLHWALADAFTICDAYHASVIGPTMPNRLYALSGTIDPTGEHGGPVVSTPGVAQSPAAVGSVDWQTMFEVLSDHQIGWKVYQPPNSSVGPDEKENLAVGFNALLYFKQYLEDPASELYRRAFLPVWPDEFAADVSGGTLPAVSWIIPSLVDSEHPSAAPLNGGAHVARVLSTLMASPDVWAKTVVFVTYDENGGFFDHVAPPTAPKGTPGEFLSVSPLPAEAAGTAGPIGLGFRVPMLVVSPFSRGGYVNSDLFDHTSLSRFLEARFGVKAPNITAWRRKTVGDLTSTLSFGASDSTAFVPPDLARRQDALTAACPANQDPAALLDPPPKLDVATPQRMPKQQAGRAHRNR